MRVEEEMNRIYKRYKSTQTVYNYIDAYKNISVIEQLDYTKNFLYGVCN